MRILQDIVCSTTLFGDIYHIDDDLIGKIIVEDDKLEGIIMNSDDKSYFIYGSIDSNNHLEFMVRDCSFKDLDKFYKLDRGNGKYYGDYFVKTEYFTHPLGECEVSIVNPDTYRYCNEEVEIEELDSLIQNYKKKENQVIKNKKYTK